MALMVNLAEAVKDHINAGSYSEALTAERSYRPMPDLSEVQTAKCYVIPGPMEATVSARTLDAFVPSIVIGLHKAASAQADLDAMMELAQEVFDHVRGESFTVTEGECAWLGADNDPVVVSDQLDEEAVFTTRITVRFQILRGR